MMQGMHDEGNYYGRPILEPKSYDELQVSSTDSNRFANYGMTNPRQYTAPGPGYPVPPYGGQQSNWSGYHVGPTTTWIPPTGVECGRRDFMQGTPSFPAPDQTRGAAVVEHQEAYQKDAANGVPTFPDERSMPTLPNHGQGDSFKGENSSTYQSSEQMGMATPTTTSTVNSKRKMKDDGSAEHSKKTGGNVKRLREASKTKEDELGAKIAELRKENAGLRKDNEALQKEAIDLRSKMHAVLNCMASFIQPGTN